MVDHLTQLFLSAACSLCDANQPLSPQAGRCPLCLQPALPADVATHISRVLGALAQPVVHDKAARHGDVEARLVRVRVRVMVRARGSGLVRLRVRRALVHVGARLARALEGDAVRARAHHGGGQALVLRAQHVDAPGVGG